MTFVHKKLACQFKHKRTSKARARKCTHNYSFQTISSCLLFVFSQFVAGNMRRREICQQMTKRHEFRRIAFMTFVTYVAISLIFSSSSVWRFLLFSHTPLLLHTFDFNCFLAFLYAAAAQLLC